MRRPKGRGRREATCPRNDLSLNVTRAVPDSRGGPAGSNVSECTPDDRGDACLGRGAGLRIRPVRSLPRQPRPAGSIATRCDGDAAYRRQCRKSLDDRRAGEPFDRRFHISAAPNIKENVSLPARELNLHDDVEFTPSVAPKATTPAAPDDTTASAEPKDAAALPGLQPAETPAAAAADSATSPAPTSDPPAMVPRPESSSAAASTDADRAPPAPAAAPAEAEQETKVPVVPGPGTEPAAVPGVAAIEPGRDWRGFRPIHPPR